MVFDGEIHFERFQDPAEDGMRPVRPNAGMSEHLDVQRVTHGDVQFRERHGDEPRRECWDQEHFE